MHSERRTFVGRVMVAIAALAILSACQPQPQSQKDSQQQSAQPSVEPTTDGGGDKKEAISETAKADESVRPDTHEAVQVPAAVSSALEMMQKKIMEYVSTEGTKYSFGSFVDPDSGRIVLSTDAPAEIVAKLIDLPGATDEQRQAAKDTRVEQVTTTDLWNRRDDVQSFWGAAGITDGAFICSSGYAVRDSSGRRFMTTAGHCFADGATVMVESGARTYGTVSNRHLPSVNGGWADMELVGGQSYSPALYTAGVTSTTHRRVVSAGDACFLCGRYCHSGRTTGENCDHTAIWLSGLVCTESGCMFPTTVFTGGNLPQRGDSGGAFYGMDNYGNAWIRGNVIAGGGPFAYAEPWSMISSTMGVSIVT